MKIMEILSHPVSSKKADMKFGLVFCYVMALLVPSVGVAIMLDLHLSKKEMLLGITLMLILSLLCSISGLLFDLSNKLLMGKKEI